MKKLRLLNRVIFLVTGHLAGYQIISGMDSYNDLTTFYFTISFGVLLLASILLLLLGFEIFKNNFVAIIAVLIPLTLSLGMINSKFQQYHLLYFIIITLGFIISIYLRFYGNEKIASLSLGTIHGASGIVIFLLPIILIFQNAVSYIYTLISFGGILIGVVGVLIFLSKGGNEIIDNKKLEMIFPTILFFTTLTFVIGLGAN